MTLFIVNPNSGAKKDGAEFALTVKNFFPEAEVKFTERAGHAGEIAAHAAAKGYKSVIACGGDGTINETASALKNTDTALGIIPRGSGNGFAREIGMSTNNLKALVQLQQAKPVLCDMGQINDDFFINVAGVGIEAVIAHAFARHGKRGMLPYFLIGAKTVFTYKPKHLTVVADGKEMKINPLTLVFANGRQYGSEFKIAPKASLTDGLLDMVQVLPKNLFRLALSLPSFFNSEFRPLDPTVVDKIQNAEIFSDEALYYHVDGEPKKAATNKITVKIIKSCIKILTVGQ
ncbi:Kinase family protein [Elusimicrobium minutum Pei191]|uniref:Kinase family protein n=1 Tax=Elusimicrobium minutum (strain Pei191) TaxID=445932 RepID=B2KAQ2_ELUMP|nr:diacylglycerol kinase family protein [Elusimicrobium minutum]ACC97598.1 Kinase family protein [Elusimicrobium minutum Pei191]